MLHFLIHIIFIRGMGLDYLNKKVWHPGSMKNIQKVWDAQQAQLEVIKRQKERAKKLQDEQYNE